MGNLHGVRIRKNDKFREAAASEKAALEIQAEQSASGLRAHLTRLTPDQASEAEAVFRRLEGRPRSLEFYVDFALAQYRELAREKSGADAIDEYLEVRKADCAQGAPCHRQLRSIGCELRAMASLFKSESVSELTPPVLTDSTKRGTPGQKTFNNRRGLVGTFLKHCFIKHRIATDPMSWIPHFK